MNEKYIPLYRKYRPQTLEQIVGQEHIKKALTSAIELNKIAHAYLFTGSRGTGKTSSARILAKSLNCEQGPTVTPCGKCASCIDVTNSTPVDVIEIDAASNRTVEDAQNILEKVQYVPINGKYKIYIIDEVHMLTNHAFNALLKTLEEPPENVIFILATTEPHKVLDTIKSRCQRFDFKRISTEDIANHLEYIAKQENINIEKDALFAIAKNSEGGMRDSIALLDQLSILGATHPITVDDINSLLGRISFDTLMKIANTIIKSNPQEAIQTLESIYNDGNEPTQILSNMLEYFKNMLLVKTCDEKIVLELTQYSENQIEEMKPLSKELETHQIIFLVEKIATYIKEIKISTTPHLWLEVALIDLANLTENTKLVELQNRLTKLESGSSDEHAVHPSYKTAPSPMMKPSMKPAGPVQPKVEPHEVVSEVKVEKVETPTPVAPKEEVAKVEEKQEFEPEPMPMSKPRQAEPVDGLISTWTSILQNISSPGAQAFLKLAKPVELTAEKAVIVFGNDGLVSRFNSNKIHKKALEDACAIVLGSGVQVIARTPEPNDAQIIEASQKKNNNPSKVRPEHVLQEKPVEKVAAKTEVQPKEEPKAEPQTETKAAPQTSDDEDVSDSDSSEFLAKGMQSDQMNMIIRLFDGKTIE